jgi:hypothetical protein
MTDEERVVVVVDEVETDARREHTGADRHDQERAQHLTGLI